MKKIVFINQEAGYLMIDIINAYVNAGYNCVLITGRLVESNVRLYESVKLDNIIRYGRKNFVHQLYTSAVAFLQIWVKVFFKYRNEELFIVSNPPFAPILPIFVPNKKYRILIYDLYPESAYKLNYIKENSIFVRIFKYMNKKSYSKACQIFTISDGMRNEISKYVCKEKIQVIPIWGNNELLKPIPKKGNPFALKLGIENKFIILYSGNLGKDNNLETVIQVANKLRSNEELIFLIIGEGIKKSKLQQLAQEKKLNNVVFLPWQHPSDMPYSMACADLGVISTDINSSNLTFPSKMFNYLAVGAPILSITGRDSEITKFLTKYKCGVSFLPNEINDIIDFIVRISQDKNLHRELKNNALSASTFFSKDNAKLFLA